MSISSEIQRLKTAKNNMKTSIQNKGVQIDSNEKLATFPSYIKKISTEEKAPSLPEVIVAGETPIMSNLNTYSFYDPTGEPKYQYLFNIPKTGEYKLYIPTMAFTVSSSYTTTIELSINQKKTGKVFTINRSQATNHSYANGPFIFQANTGDKIGFFISIQNKGNPVKVCCASLCIDWDIFTKGV